MSLEHFVGPEMKEMLEHTHVYKGMVCQRNIGANWMSSQWTTVEINLKVILDYNPKYKINGCAYAIINHK